MRHRENMVRIKRRQFLTEDLPTRLRERLEAARKGGYNFVRIPAKEAERLVRLLSDK